MYKIAIPSYKRPNLLATTTIPMLMVGNCKEIYLFINEDEEESYREVLNNIDIKINYCLLKNCKGIGNVRNYIRNFFDVGDWIISIDDDIKGLYIGDEIIEDVNDFIFTGFEIAQNEGVKMWGVQLCSNPLFHKEGYTTNLTYINGSFTGVIISDEELTTDIDHFEDYLFSILHFLRDGKLLKFTECWIKTKPFNKIGGICQQLGGLDKRKQEAEENGMKLAGHFPDMMRLKYSKKYDVQSIRLNYKFKWSPDAAISGYNYLTDYI